MIRQRSAESCKVIFTQLQKHNGFIALTMSRNALTGTRIRDQRQRLGVKQADLARRAGISASYLNLIEHNRRRIGGKLVLDLSRALGVEPSVLTEGAETALLAALQEAAADRPQARAEVDDVEDFAGRFPGWAALLMEQSARVAELQRNVEGLTDRLTHDPFLSTALHEVLSTVTAIRSSAAILADTKDIDPEWQARFLRNIRDDAHRLGHGAEALVRHLDQSEGASSAPGTPQEEFERMLEGVSYHLADLERALPVSPKALANAQPQLNSAPARQLAEAHFERYASDAAKLPLADFERALRGCAFDPARVAAAFGVPLGTVLRRWASLPAQGGARPGLVVCDGSGAITFRKPTDGFALPRFGAICPLWPLFRALTQPTVPLREVVELGERAPQRFLAYAVCEPSHPEGFDGPQVFEATMLILPEGHVPFPPGQKHPIGTGCRICPRTACAARREPSLLSEGM